MNIIFSEGQIQKIQAPYTLSPGEDLILKFDEKLKKDVHFLVKGTFIV